ncbi:hypothetical protein [Nocardioides insulae]|uniref:hypothetical protein n=1 Tax=Nocardioides insulae TaxID=394734 RepID=UPI001FDFCDE7|nr:hypothetical protein [Nocardioides insulae]
MSSAIPREELTEMTDPRIRSSEMNLIHEDLARAQIAARLGEAHDRETGHELARARRLSRKAEKAAMQARLALARVL